MKLLFIACGGALGSILRYLVTVAAQQFSGAAAVRLLGHAFPVGTLVVNVLGCLMIGVLAALFNRHLLPHDHYRLALTVGFLGGFTTFSAFGLETFILLQSGHPTLAMLNIGANVAVGLF